MSALELLKEQFEKVKSKTTFYIENISTEKWNETPPVLESNMNWQIGHITLANYLHGIASISGPNEKIRSLVDMQQFVKWYGPKSQPKEFLDEKLNVEQLLSLYNLVLEIIYENINNFDIDKLKDDSTAVPNPSAQTKLDALLTLVNHQSWHNGQIAVLNRVLSNE